MKNNQNQNSQHHTLAVFVWFTHVTHSKGDPSGSSDKLPPLGRVAPTPAKNKARKVSDLCWLWQMKQRNRDSL